MNWSIAEEIAFREELIDAMIDLYAYLNHMIDLQIKQAKLDELNKKVKES